MTHADKEADKEIEEIFTIAHQLADDIADLIAMNAHWSAVSNTIYLRLIREFTDNHIPPHVAATSQRAARPSLTTADGPEQKDKTT